jgi:hypothetical protein
MSAATIGRNDPCPCGSGKKFKKCCLNKIHFIFDGPKKPESKIISSVEPKLQ